MYTAMLYTIYISPKIVQCSGITYLNLDSSGSNPNERGCGKNSRGSRRPFPHILVGLGWTLRGAKIPPDWTSDANWAAAYV